MIVIFNVKNMEIREKTLAINRGQIATMAQFLVLLSVAGLAPLASNQLITGTIVNATLFIAAATLGVEGAILIGILPSFFALLSGTLPMALAPLIPYIILSNALLIFTFIYLKKTNYWLKVLVAAGLKFIFLSSISFFVIQLFFKGKIAMVGIAMFSWPQLLTALLGGGLAYLVLKGKDLPTYFKSRNNNTKL